MSIFIIISYQTFEIAYILFYCIHLYFIDDHCQYWFNKADGTLTSPNFGINNLGKYQDYDHNLNCIWILDADQGFYINFEIDLFAVNSMMQMKFNSTTELTKFIVLA